MEKENGSTRSFSGLVQWATTRPQVYVVYFLCLILVWGVSFLAGTLNPKKGLSTPPAPISTPRN
jgi:hypothetical protein